MVFRLRVPSVAPNVVTGLHTFQAMRSMYAPPLFCAFPAAQNIIGKSIAQLIRWIGISGNAFDVMFVDANCCRCLVRSDKFFRKRSRVLSIKLSSSSISIFQCDEYRPSAWHRSCRTFLFAQLNLFGFYRAHFIWEIPGFTALPIYRDPIR